MKKRVRTIIVELLVVIVLLTTATLVWNHGGSLENNSLIALIKQTKKLEGTWEITGTVYTDDEGNVSYNSTYIGFLTLTNTSLQFFEDKCTIKGRNGTETFRFSLDADEGVLRIISGDDRGDLKFKYDIDNTNDILTLNYSAERYYQVLGDGGDMPSEHLEITCVRR